MLTVALTALVMAQNVPADLGAPPPLYPDRTARPQCACPDETPPDLITIEGLVVDAEVTLGADRRSVNERQATIFEVAQPLNDKKRVKVWHSTLEAQCGLTFEYGRKYKITARRTENDALETDLCLMRQ